MAKAAATGRKLSLVLCLFVVLTCLGSKLPFRRKLKDTKTWQPQVDALQEGSELFKVLVLDMMRENTMEEYLLLMARMCCWHEANGQFISSWSFDINERKMLHYSSTTGAWSTLDPIPILLLEKLKKNVEVTTFLQMTSQSHCKTWFQEFKSHWEIKYTGSSKAMTIIPHISVLLILLTCSLLLLLSGGSSAMTG